MHFVASTNASKRKVRLLRMQEGTLLSHFSWVLMQHCHTENSTIGQTSHERRAHLDLSQGPADLQSAALTIELCTHDCEALASSKSKSNRGFSPERGSIPSCCLHCSSLFHSTSIELCPQVLTSLGCGKRASKFLHFMQSDTCGIQTHAGRPHRLSRPTP